MLLTHRPLEHRIRAVVALLVLALVALGLVACGGSNGGSGSGGSSGGGDSADAQTLLTQTFSGTHKLKSGKVDLQLKITADGDPSIRGPIQLDLTGPFQSAGADQLPKFDLALDIHAQGQGFQAGVTSTTDRLFVKFGGTAYEVPAQTVAQLKQSFKQQGSGGQRMDLGGIDPTKWLKDPTVTGDETLDGVATQHISAQVDVNALLDDLDTLLGKVRGQLPSSAGAQIPDKLSSDTRRQIEDAVKSASVDVWTGKDDKTLRKLTVKLAIEPPASANAPKSIGLDFSVELQDLNAPQSIQAPSSSRPLSELTGQLQGLLGGALGGGALGGGGSGSSPNIDKYTQCLQKAGGDVTKAQACAKLLTQ